MSVTDNSKATKYQTWCAECRADVKIVVRSQRMPMPTTCPFCKGDLLVERTDTFRRTSL